MGLLEYGAGKKVILWKNLTPTRPATGADCNVHGLPQWRYKKIIWLSRGVYPPPQRPWYNPPPKWPSGSPQFLIIMHLKYYADRYDMTFMSFDNHFETKVLFLMYFGSQILTNIMMIQIMAEWQIDKQLN